MSYAGGMHGVPVNLGTLSSTTILPYAGRELLCRLFLKIGPGVVWPAIALHDLAPLRAVPRHHRFQLQPSKGRYRSRSYTGVRSAVSVSIRASDTMFRDTHLRRAFHLEFKDLAQSDTMIGSEKQNGIGTLLPHPAWISTMFDTNKISWLHYLDTPEVAHLDNKKAVDHSLG
jgi:hypothetical protein